MSSTRVSATPASAVMWLETDDAMEGLRAAVKSLTAADLVALSLGLLSLKSELPTARRWFAAVELLAREVDRELDAFATRYSSEMAAELREAAGVKAVPE